MMQTPQSPQPNPIKKRGIVIALIVLFVLGLGLGLVILVRPENCFDPASYNDLVGLAQEFEGGEGVELSSVVQDQELFTQSVYFMSGTDEVNEETSDDAAGLFKQLGDYYKNHEATAPINIVLESSYIKDYSSEKATQRTKVIKDSLVQAGVGESSIAIQNPSAVDVGDESLYDDDIVDGMPVGIHVTPVSRCEE